MKQFAKVLAVIGFTSAITVATGLGQPGPLITVDELGNGNFNGVPLPSFQSSDSSGIVTLTYRLPFATVAGDVQLFEPNATGPNPLSDILRFDGFGNLYFFSEVEPTDVPPFDPADVFIFPQHNPFL